MKLIVFAIIATEFFIMFYHIRKPFLFSFLFLMLHILQVEIIKAVSYYVRI